MGIDRSSRGETEPEREQQPSERAETGDQSDQARQDRIDAAERNRQTSMTLEEIVADVADENGEDDDTFLELALADLPDDHAGEVNRPGDRDNERAETAPGDSPSADPRADDPQAVADELPRQAADELGEQPTPEVDEPDERSTLDETKEDVDAAYATGDQDKVAEALREALAKVEGRPESERQTTWQTIAEELGGEVRSYPNYEAAKRELGVVPGTEIHHIVEQSQARLERSEFDLARINSTDNLTRIPPDIHRQISSEYSTKDPFAGETVRDLLNGAPWDEQHEAGVDMLNKVFKEMRDDE